MLQEHNRRTEYIGSWFIGTLMKLYKKLRLCLVSIVSDPERLIATFQQLFEMFLSSVSLNSPVVHIRNIG